MPNLKPSEITRANHPIATARAAYNAATDARAAYTDELMRKREAEWLSAGGCERCDGCGTVCVWGTLDAMDGSYDEFGACPACDGKRDPWAGSNRHRKSGHPHVEVPPVVQGTDERARMDAIDEDVKLAETFYNTACAEYAMVKGARVRVDGGRKLPRDTEGEIVAVEHVARGRNDYFTPRGDPSLLRICVKPDGASSGTWINGEQAYVIKPAADVGAPSMSGTDRQVAWAFDIRRRALAAGVVDLAFCKMRDDDCEAARIDVRSAKFWIDNRDNLANVVIVARERIALARERAA